MRPSRVANCVLLSPEQSSVVATRVLVAAADPCTDIVCEAVLALVRTSRAAQGLPPTVTDPGALSRIAALLQSVSGVEPNYAVASQLVVLA